MNVIKCLFVVGLCACCTPSLSGCSSAMTHTGGSQGYYPGTRASASILTDSNTSMAIRPLALIDLPFSAVLDTLLLPWDYYRAGAADSMRERIRQSELEKNTQTSLGQASPWPANQHPPQP